jgi:ABC-type Fe3+/spermidine/putrescine transport system ATPase subunit
MLLEVQNIVQRYGQDIVLRDISFAVERGEIVCLLGPSGCGKSTLLRVIAGLEHNYTGTVRFDGQPIDRVPPHARGFGFMFQDWALFPHRDVQQNIAFGLRMQRLPRPSIERRAMEMMTLVGLPQHYAKRTIFELSGGERQRVALARSLAPQPRLLMLDEPLGALDRTLRDRLTGELRTIIKQVGLTSIYVTHDQAESFVVADRLLVMNQGRIVQAGTPATVYRHPASDFVARFLGFNNLLPGRHIETCDSTLVLETPLGRIHAGDVPTEKKNKEQRTENRGPGARTSFDIDTSLVLIRPEAAELVHPAAVNYGRGRCCAEHVSRRHTTHCIAHERCRPGTRR